MFKSIAPFIVLKLKSVSNPTVNPSPFQVINTVYYVVLMCSYMGHLDSNQYSCFDKNLSVVWYIVFFITVLSLFVNAVIV